MEEKSSMLILAPDSIDDASIVKYPEEGIRKLYEYGRRKAELIAHFLGL